jgi:hypothetical protein
MLVGFTDGDGTFSLSQNNNGVFTFKLTQSAYNIHILEYIQSKLGGVV